MTRSAAFSDCGKYRYLLSRIWSDDKIAMCIGLNPSNAGSTKDDPTITRLIKTLTHLGYGGLKMVNLYAYISSNPKVLHEVPDPLKDNDKWIITTAFGCQEIIFCWGGFKNIDYRAKQMINLFPNGKCFGKTKEGRPWHPLAMMYAGMKITDATLTPYQ